MAALGLLALPFLLIGWLARGITHAAEWLVRLSERRRARRRAAIEAELDRTQEQLRRTILDLSAALGADAHETRKALIRESYLASGRVPEG